MSYTHLKAYFSEHYEDARENFLRAAAQAAAATEHHLLPGYRGSRGEDLAIDEALIRCENDEAPLVVISSAVHGVEGHLWVGLPNRNAQRRGIAKGGESARCGPAILTRGQSAWIFLPAPRQRRQRRSEPQFHRLLEADPAACESSLCRTSSAVATTCLATKRRHLAGHRVLYSQAWRRGIS